MTSVYDRNKPERLVEILGLDTKRPSHIATLALATDSVEAGEAGVVGEVPGADTSSAAGDGEGGATDGISADGAGEETMAGGASESSHSHTAHNQ